MARAQKRDRARVAKENRKNLRGWAEGAREEVLTAHLDAYAAAMDGGWKTERKYLKRVCLEFHARVDWRTPDHEEPVLRPWDPKGKAAVEVLSEEEEALKRERINALDARIRRWYKYRIRRLRKQGRIASSLDPTKNPYAILLAKLSGISAPPKARQGYQQWMRESYAEKVAPEVAPRWEEERDQRAAEGKKGKAPKAGFRAQVARDLYQQLSAAEQKGCADRATKEAKDAKAAYVKALQAPPAQDPASRLSCIKSVGEFMGPILQGLHALTGLHSTIILGGPMPQYGGELRTIHVSYGRNKSALGEHWPQWDKGRFSTHVLGFLTEYLATAFDPEDCKRAALSHLADLDGAKYTMPGGEGAGGDSSSESSDSDSDSDDDSDDNDTGDDDTDIERPRKKAKTAPAKRAVGSSSGAAPLPSASPPAPPSSSAPAASSSSSGARLPSASPPTPPSSSAPAASSSSSAAPLPSASAPTPPSSSAPAASSSTMRAAEILSPELAALQARYDEENAAARAAHDMKAAWDEFRANNLPQKAKRKPRAPKGATAAAVAGPPRRSARRAAREAPEEDSEMRDVEMDISPDPTGDPTAVSTASDAPSAVTVSTASATSTASTTSATTRSGTSTASPSPTTTTTPPALPTTTTTTTPVTTPPMSPDGSALGALGAPDALQRLTLVPCPADAPEWFVNARAAICGRNLGCHFDALLGAWTRIEYASRFEHADTNLPSRGRPSEVTTWVRGKRVGMPPTAANLATFERQWGGWWDSLQPEWREKDTEGHWAVGGEYGGGGREWGPLYQWGVNGTVSLLAGLYSWGCAVIDSGDQAGAWEDALADVTWMLEGMATYYEKFNRKF